jgi:hypothetical protein
MQSGKVTWNTPDTTKNISTLHEGNKFRVIVKSSQDNEIVYKKDIKLESIDTESIDEDINIIANATYTFDDYFFLIIDLGSNQLTYTYNLQIFQSDNDDILSGTLSPETTSLEVETNGISGRFNINVTREGNPNTNLLTKIINL